MRKRWCSGLVAAWWLLGGGTAMAAEPLRVGTVQNIGEALTEIATRQGLFGAVGLDVDLQPHRAGKDALARLLAGELDITASAPLPLVRAAMDARAAGEPPGFRVVANLMQSSRMTKVVARADHGIEAPIDLEGRRVGVYFGSSSEYYWHSFTQFHGIDAAAIELVDLPPESLTAALLAGHLDAAVLFEPHAARVLEQAAFPANVFRPAQTYSNHWLLVTSSDALATRGEAVAAYLEALIRAETLPREQPELAAALVSEALAMPLETVAVLLARASLYVSLSAGAVQNLRAHADWLTARNGQPALDIYPLLDGRPLTALRPTAVGLLP